MLYLSRYELVKKWTGDFVGTSEGEMLASSGPSTSVMAYVAMEHMTGELGGGRGTFLLAHRATMTKDDANSGEMQVTVVKGTGTGKLTGIQGFLAITIDSAGRHSYVLTYDLP